MLPDKIIKLCVSERERERECVYCVCLCVCVYLRACVHLCAHVCVCLRACQCVNARPCVRVCLVTVWCKHCILYSHTKQLNPVSFNSKNVWLNPIWTGAWGPKRTKQNCNLPLWSFAICLLKPLVFWCVPSDFFGRLISFFWNIYEMLKQKHHQWYKPINTHSG